MATGRFDEFDSSSAYGEGDHRDHTEYDGQLVALGGAGSQSGTRPLPGSGTPRNERLDLCIVTRAKWNLPFANLHGELSASCARIPRVPEAFAHKDQEDQDFDARILDYAFRSYVSMLLFALQVEKIFSFHVLIPTDGVVSVRINDQPNAWSLPRATQSWEEGDAIYPEDLEVDHLPLLDDASGIPFIRGRMEGDTWRLEYQLSYPPIVREDYYDAAVEFISAATLAQEGGLMRVFVENAFHAAEHLARAELLSYPPTAPAVMPGARHKKLSETFNLWAKLENTDADYKDLFNTLHRLRPAATYLESDFALSMDEAGSMLARLFRWQWWVQSVVHEGGGTNPIRVVATREIESGSLVGQDDYTIRQRKASHT